MPDAWLLFDDRCTCELCQAVRSLARQVTDAITATNLVSQAYAPTEKLTFEAYSDKQTRLFTAKAAAWQAVREAKARERLAIEKALQHHSNLEDETDDV